MSFHVNVFKSESVYEGKGVYSLWPQNFTVAEYCPQYSDNCGELGYGMNFSSLVVIVVGHVKEYPTKHMFGIPEYFCEFQSKIAL